MTPEVVRTVPKSRPHDAVSDSLRLKTDEADLFRRARAGDQRARERLVGRYLPLAKSLALRFSGRSAYRRCGCEWAV